MRRGIARASLFELEAKEAAHSVHCPPPKRGRDREGAYNKIHAHKLTPSPTLPRRRGREQTEFALTLIPFAGMRVSGRRAAGDR
jgi:hypothetical protein